MSPLPHCLLWLTVLSPKLGHAWHQCQRWALLAALLPNADNKKDGLCPKIRFLDLLRLTSLVGFTTWKCCTYCGTAGDMLLLGRPALADCCALALRPLSRLTITH